MDLVGPTSTMCVCVFGERGRTACTVELRSKDVKGTAHTTAQSGDKMMGREYKRRVHEHAAYAFPFYFHHEKTILIGCWRLLGACLRVVLE